ncbi:MAG: glycosyltransferase family 39 protein [Candidatus Omnitrophica bacterium]|nr:glycosyltransferase family 39 protein [Candidatus Omnitrophota bacterium]
MKGFRREGLLITVLAIFAGFLFFTGLDTMPLTDPDEVFYAETAREMTERGEFLTPYIFGKPQFEKPPFYYWLVILSFRAFGINEFSARFPSALLAIFGVIGVYLLGRAMLNRRAAFLAAVIMATSVEYLALSRACVTDMALAVFILYAFLFFFYGHNFTSGKTKWYLFSAAFLGIAVLTKGPIGVLLPVIIIGIYLTAAKDLKSLKKIPFLSGTLLFLAISLPWYFLVYKTHGKEFIDMFFGFHNITRFLHPEHPSSDFLYYYIIVILAGFFPWSAFLPVSLWQARREKEQRIRRSNLFLIIWCLVIFIFFTFSRTKLVTYVFPLFPALALLTGGAWDGFLREELEQKIRRSVKISSCLFFAIIVGGMIGFYVLVKIRYPAIACVSAAIAVIFILVMAFFTLQLLRERYLRALIVFMVSFMILVFPVTRFVLPEIGKYESSREISKEALKFATGNEVIGAETHYRRGVAFYTLREDIPDVHKWRDITRFLRRKDRVWAIIKDKNHRLLYSGASPPDWPTYVVYKLGKKVMVTNKIPKDGKFLKMRTKNEPD